MGIAGKRGGIKARIIWEVGEELAFQIYAIGRRPKDVITRDGQKRVDSKEEAES